MNELTVLDAIEHRRSIRSYAGVMLDVSTVLALLRAAVRAPTAMHNEPWMFVVVQDRGALKRYSDAAKTALLDEAEHYQGLHYPALASKDSNFLKALGDPNFNIFYNAGTLVLICARLTNLFVAPDCWLAAENLMLAAVGMKLGTCCVGSALPAMNSAAIKAELGIPADVAAVAAIIVGVPAEHLRPTGRKVPSILTWKKTGPD